MGRNSLLSIYGFSDRRRLPLRLVERAIRRLAVRAEMFIDGIPYFTEEDCRRIETAVVAILGTTARQLVRPPKGRIQQARRRRKPPKTIWTDDDLSILEFL